MSRMINPLERLVEFAARLPWWSGLIAAAGSWAMLQVLTLNAAPLPRDGVALPAVRGLALAAQVLLPAAFLTLSAWSAWLGYRHQRNYAEVAAEQGGSVLQKLSGREFENLVAEFFRRKSFAVEQRAARMPEAGVDLVASIGEDRYLVQCKHWRVQRVGVAVVRELCAVAAAEGTAGVFVVTSGSFTVEARRHVERNRITIERITGEQLRLMIRGLDPVAA
ncbi:MAG: restriction endonuclease [Betaproteobacteria bacterium]|nr:restriction endonuclease [Betaproteobacteria bacterium]